MRPLAVRFRGRKDASSIASNTTASSSNSTQSEVARSGPPKFAESRHVFYLGVYLTILLILLIYLLVEFWPEPAAATGEAATPAPPPVSAATGEAANAGSGKTLSWKGGVDLPFAISFEISDEVRILLIVLFAGAIGNMIHTLRSFIMFVGNRQLVTSWIPWYMIRPASGAALALVFYFVISTGLTNGSPGTGDIPIGGIAGLAALVGLFNDLTVGKLKEIFAAILSTKKVSAGSDQLKPESPNPKPEAGALNPQKVVAGTTDLSVTVTGLNFAAGAEARVDGQPRSTEVKSATEIVFTLAGEDVASPGDRNVTVVNPPPGGGESEPLVLPVK